MADVPISGLTPETSIDRSADYLEVYDASANASRRANVNSLLGGISGAPVGTSDSQTLTNKVLTSPTINTPTLTVLDNALTIQDNSDPTKQAQLQLSGITAGQTRTYTLPDATTTLVGTGATQTLTNKTLTAPTITNPTITVDTISEFTGANGVTIDGLNIKDGAFARTALPAGSVLQVVSTNYANVATGTTIIPLDDTIPQNTEGTEFMTRAITPYFSTSLLVIEATVYISNSVGSESIAALFQDTTADALTAVSVYQGTATGRNNLRLTYSMTAGTTSSTTFKIRAGGDTAGTVTFNGFSAARKFGAITKSNFTIYEVKV